ncbi:hypothetical protein, conserved [Eimeria brunetti]|uniref:Transmembrane protein n=1 Tax=Eimeria brunetti TaxID=51314 RepID=U6LF12_9EIME|nr:hypothetical protein, conserved [Eimeria brunetti]
MVPPWGIRRSAAAKNSNGVSSRAGGRGAFVVVHFVSVLSLVLHLGGALAGLAVCFSFAHAASSPLTGTAAGAPASASPVGEEGAADGLQKQQQQQQQQEHRPSSFSAEDTGDVPAFRVIPYDQCGKPLAVGGQIVHCDEGSGKPHVEFSSFDGPQGPVLNQSFPMDIPPDFFLRRRIAQDRKRMKQKAAEAEFASTAASPVEKEGREAIRMQSEEKGEILDEPHFIRIFGRWTPYPRGLNLWLDRSVTSSFERGREDQTPAALQQPPLLFTHMGSPPPPRLSHPVLYWRQTITSSPMENSCIALIKLPVSAPERASSSPDISTGAAAPAAAAAAAAAGRSADGYAAAATAMPGSCEDAQRLVAERQSNGASPDPFWLSCGPELQLSRLAKYLTFSISQKKVNEVLAALDYSVEIWEEPHEIKGKEGEAEGPSPDTTEQKTETANEPQEKTEEQQQQEAAASAFRGGEARRLAAEQEATIEKEPPKWRVGVCLLNSRKGKEGTKEKAATGDRRESSTAAATAAAPAQSPLESEHEAEAAKAEPELQREGKEKEEEAPSKVGEENQQTESSAASASAHPLGEAATLVGEVKFHLSPAVASQPNDNPDGEPEAIQIRHFIDAGWIYTRYIQGINVSRFNRLAIKESRGGIAQPCVGFWDEHSLLSVAPDAYSWDEATQKGTLRFVFGSSLKDGIENRDALLDAVPGHHPTARMQICFYPNEEQPFGLFMGEVRFVIDSADATLLVCFILFVFLALPLTCAVALSFHVYKHRHLRERLQRLVLVQQRDAVEQLLMRELGLSTEDQDDANDDDDEEETHA